MASEVDIANRALQKIGAKRIVSLTEDTVNGRAVNLAYEILRDAELRAHTWNFSIERASLAADSSTPDWGRSNSFTLPSDFLRLLPPYPEDNSNQTDWQIEGRKILTNDSAPLYIRYVKIVTDPNDMDALFREALSARIAAEICEELTQSNSKKTEMKDDYKLAIREARRVNAIENVSAETPEDTWISERQ